MSERNFPINLESLIELSARLNETHDEKFILNAALLSLMGKLTISNGYVLIPDKGKSSYELMLSKGHHSIERLDYFEPEEFQDIQSVSGRDDLRKNGICYLVSVSYRNKLLAVICLGKRLIESELNENEMLYVKLVSSITANALQISNEHNNLKKTKTKLEYRNLTLTTLFEISREFSTINSSDKIIKLLSLRLMGQLMVNKFALFTIDNNKQPESVFNRCDKEIKPEYLCQIIKLKKVVIRKEGYPDELKSIFDETEIEVIAPVILQDELKGVIFVGPRMNKANFDSENVNFIESLGITAVTALENERLFKLEVEKKRMENELDLALEIQRGLLPNNFISSDRFAIHGFSNPSRFVGGDYFDYIVREDGKLIVVIADVSGKGMAASLIMANLQSALKVLSSLNLPIDEIVNRLNSVVYDNTAADRFVTFFIGVIDFDKLSIEFVNAGHNPPLLFNSNGSYVMLEAENVPLGIFDSHYRYNSKTLSLKTEDLLICYTDGITEAQNKEGKEYGEANLVNLCKAAIGKSPHEISQKISQDIHEYTKGLNQYDDLTCLIIMMLKKAVQ